MPSKIIIDVSTTNIVNFSRNTLFRSCKIFFINNFIKICFYSNFGKNIKFKDNRMVYIFFFNFSFSKFGTVWTRLEKKIPIENPHSLVNKNLKTKHGLNHLNVQIIAWCHHSISDKSETTSIFRSLFKGRTACISRPSLYTQK